MSGRFSKRTPRDSAKTRKRKAQGNSPNDDGESPRNPSKSGTSIRPGATFGVTASPVTDNQLKVHKPKETRKIDKRTHTGNSNNNNNDRKASPKSISANSRNDDNNNDNNTVPNQEYEQALVPANFPEAPPPPTQFFDPYANVGPGDVAIFWDFENIKIPSGCTVPQASEALRNCLVQYGRIVERRLYYDSGKPTEMSLPRGDLDLSGFTLVDCPTRNDKETLDKKLIVDLLFFAWERAARGARACVVLITSDGDYAYTLARLQDIGVYTIVMYRSSTVARVLPENANLAMDWEQDVLKNGGMVQMERSYNHGGNSNNHNGSNSSGVGQSHSASSGAPAASSFMPDMSGLPIAAPPPTANNDASLTQAYMTDPSGEGMLILYCSCVLIAQRLALREISSDVSLYSVWGTSASVAIEFYQKCRSREKDVFQRIQQEATKRRLVEWARKDIRQGGKPMVQIHDRRGKRPPGLSMETYNRLTGAGIALLHPDPDADGAAIHGDDDG